MESNNLMNDTQHGFRKGRSCLSQLITHYDYILSQAEKGENVDVIYLDFAKAFDKVDHGVLCHKLKQLKISGKVGRWIHNFLADRIQTVHVKNEKSEKIKVRSSVPQGTVLGPILFLILIIDIDNNVSARVSSFADDTRVTGTISSKEDTTNLQNDLNKIYNWQKNNNMEFNADKFELLRYGKMEQLKISTHYTAPGGTRIKEKETVKDLGVMMSKNLTFSSHIEKVCAEAKKYSGLLMRSFTTRNPLIMKTLWNSIIQPRIDYCSQLWSPYKAGEILRLESLLRSFTAKITPIAHLTPWERLKALQMMSIQRRHGRYKIIFIWKNIEGLATNFGILTHESKRHGRLCQIPKLNNQAKRAIQD